MPIPLRFALATIGVTFAGDILFRAVLDALSVFPYRLLDLGFFMVAFEVGLAYLLLGWLRPSRFLANRAHVLGFIALLAMMSNLGLSFVAAPFGPGIPDLATVLFYMVSSVVEGGLAMLLYLALEGRIGLAPSCSEAHP